MEALATILIVGAIVLLIPALVIMGAYWLDVLEHRAALRARLKSIGPFDPSNDVSGDVAHLPSGLKVSASHFGTDTTQGRNDHVR